MACANDSLHVHFSIFMRKALALLATLILFVAHTPTAAYAAGEINNYLDLKQACRSGGSYVLTANITYDASDPDCGVDPDYPSSGYPAYPRITGVSVTINLNDHTIDANSATNAFCIDDGDPAVVTSLTITGDGVVKGARASGICVFGNQAAFTLAGGTVTGNDTGVFTNGGNIFISGGCITDNAQHGIRIHSNSSYKASLGLRGNPTFSGNGFNDILLIADNDSDTNPITIYDSLAKPASPITVNNAIGGVVKPGVFTTGFKTYCEGEPTEYFESHSKIHSVVWEGDEAALIQNYAIKFVDSDGTVLKDEVSYPKGTKGDDIEKPANPTKVDDAQYTYAFAGWTPAIGDVTTNVTYTATYAPTLRKYPVTFVDEDGTTVLKGATEYEYGTTADKIAKPADPTKAADKDYTYAFAGWAPEVADVTGEATYKATYTATPIAKGTLKFDLNGGMLDGKTGTITIVANVGETIKLPGAPVKSGYAFKCWKGSEYAAGADYKVEGDHEFTAEWTKNSQSAQPSKSSPETKASTSTKSSKVSLPKTDDPLASTSRFALAAAFLSLVAFIFAGRVREGHSER